MPMLLGSYFGFIVSGLMVLLLIVRIVGEEAMLIEELKGYVDYREKVKYRLLPNI
jgi:protein-S-isoprenylcysteine O-methyltransferase Ste14